MLLVPGGSPPGTRAKNDAKKSFDRNEWRKKERERESAIDMEELIEKLEGEYSAHVFVKRE